MCTRTDTENRKSAAHTEMVSNPISTSTPLWSKHTHTPRNNSLIHGLTILTQLERVSRLFTSLCSEGFFQFPHPSSFIVWRGKGCMLIQNVQLLLLAKMARSLSLSRSHPSHANERYSMRAIILLLTLPPPSLPNLILSSFCRVLSCALVCRFLSVFDLRKPSSGSLQQLGR